MDVIEIFLGVGGWSRIFRRVELGNLGEGI